MSGIILMYHRVAAVDPDPYGLSVHPDRFVEHVEQLSRLGCVVPLTEIRGAGRATRIAVTFDDGYADNALAAVPVLARAAVPATFFITTERLGGAHFWWDRLSAALLGDHELPPGVDLTVGGRALWLALDDAAARETALRFLHRRLRPLVPEELDATVESLLELLTVPAPPEDEVTMTVDQLRTAAASAMVDFGAHTRTHLQLAGQSEERQRGEIAGSVADLAEILDCPVTSFAYPFGTPRAVGPLAPRLARDSGCLLACSTEPGAVTGRSDAHWLPRLNVRNWSGPELLARLQRLAPVPSSGDR